MGLECTTTDVSIVVADIIFSRLEEASLSNYGSSIAPQTLRQSIKSRNLSKRTQCLKVSKPCWRDGVFQYQTQVSFVCPCRMGMSKWYRVPVPIIPN
ncbi:hypothetical protein Hanom_Chr00s000001g01597951 [Helianthus anomalus]